MEKEGYFVCKKLIYQFHTTLVEDSFLPQKTFSGENSEAQYLDKEKILIQVECVVG